MKEEKGVTLISLISYVIVLLVVVSAVTLTTNFLMNNMNEVENSSKSISEINRFDLIFLKDIKQEGISIYQIGEDGRSIVFEKEDGSDIQYIYQGENIYRVENGGDKIKINEGVEEFSISSQNNEINLTICVGGNTQNKQYKLGKY